MRQGASESSKAFALAMRWRGYRRQQEVRDPVGGRGL